MNEIMNIFIMNINEYIHYFFTKTVLMQDIIYFTNLIFKC